MGLPKPEGFGEKLPDSVWLNYKDILHRLYITENKPLSVVKQTMEDEHGFQLQRLCDYEVALRDVLHFRKNLKREEWRAIAIHISERKRKAKESEVIWNNASFEAKKLRKELRRNSQPNLGLIRKVNLELPQGLVIRTPPRSPDTRAAVLLPSLEVQLAIAPAILPRVVSKGGSLPANASSPADETIWEVQRAMVEEGDFSVSPYRKLRENLPFSRCMLQILDLAQSHRLNFCLPTVDTWALAAPRLFGANPSWELFGQHIFELSGGRSVTRDYQGKDQFLKWVAISADFALLRTFFSIKSPTAGAVYEALLGNAKRLKMTGLVRVLFELRPVLRSNNLMSVNDAGFIRVAIEIGSGSDDGLDILNACLINSPMLSTTQTHDLRVWRSESIFIAAKRGDIAMLRVLVDAGWKAGPRSLQLDIASVGRIMSRIYHWDLQKEDDLSVYIELLLRVGVLDGTASPPCSDDHRPRVVTNIQYVNSITWDEMVMICPPAMRQTLQMGFMKLRPDQETGITRAGVFTAAHYGAPGLRAFLEAHEENDPFQTCVTLEECLSFSAVVNDSNTTSGLLEIGVDPHVGLLSRNTQLYHKGNLPWNPSIVAAEAGHLEVLSLLLNHINLSSFLFIAPIYELVHDKSLWGNKRIGPSVMDTELPRLANLYRSKLAAEGSLNSDEYQHWMVRTSDIMRISDGKPLETLKYIRSLAHSQGSGKKIDLEIIKEAVRHQRQACLQKHKRHSACDPLLIEGLIDPYLEFEWKGMDLLHASIRNHCSFTVVCFLSDKGFKVHSHPCEETQNTMLHDALLSYSTDRSEIVDFLLQNGADYKSCGDGLTILEASLWNIHSKTDDGDAEDRRIFERLLNLGATARQWRRKRLSKWRSLIEMLLDLPESDDLILRAIDAGAPLNACGYGGTINHWRLTPLQAAILRGHEQLARELIRRGADVHAPASPRYGLTALQAACLVRSSPRFLEYLVVVQGVDTNECPAKKFGYTSLAAAVQGEGGSLNLVELLLDHGADINTACRGRFWPFCYWSLHLRPLDIAVLEGNLDMVEFLLKAGGRSRKAGLGGAIEIAAREGHHAILSVLRSWNEKHGRQILEEEALWQKLNPEQALMLSGPAEDSDYSESDSSEDDSDIEEG